VTDTLAAGVGFVSASGTGWSCGEALGLVTCTRASLAPGAAPPISIAVTTPSDGTTLTNTASVSAAETDPVPANNTDTEGTTVSAVADLSVSKSDSPDPVVAGTDLTYTISVQNLGPSAAPATVTLTDTLPPQLTFQSASGAGWSCGETGGVVTCTRSGLAVGPAPDVTLVAAVDRNAVGSISNTATVSSPTVDPNAANDTAVESTLVQERPSLCVRADGCFLWELRDVDFQSFPSEAEFRWRVSLVSCTGALQRLDLRFVPGAGVTNFADLAPYTSPAGRAYVVDVVGGPHAGIGFTPGVGSPLQSGQSDEFVFRVAASDVTASSVLWNSASSSAAEAGRIDMRSDLCFPPPSLTGARACYSQIDPETWEVNVSWSVVRGSEASSFRLVREGAGQAEPVLVGGGPLRPDEQGRVAVVDRCPTGTVRGYRIEPLDAADRPLGEPSRIEVEACAVPLRQGSRGSEALAVLALVFFGALLLPRVRASRKTAAGRKATGLGALSLLLLWAPAASALVVDEFSTAQASLSDPPGGASSVATGGADILGQRRDLSVMLRVGAGPVSAEVSSGVLSASVTDTTPDSRGEVSVTWDGDADPTVLDPEGLAPLDLTGSGHSSFRFSVAAASAGTELVLTVYTDAANASRAALRLPAVAGGPASFYLSYPASFVPLLGGGADFADVGAIVLSVRGTETALQLERLETAAPSVAAVKEDLFVSDVPIGLTPVAPGTTYKYRVVVTNSGAQAQRVDVADLIEANLTLDGATIDATPALVDDPYETFGNVDKSVAAAGLLGNDVEPDRNGAPPALVVDTSGSPLATALGGTAALSADGSFVYSPPVGVGDAVDSFAYTATDNEGNSATAMATILIGPRIWFVDSSHSGANLGTLANPFQSITAANLNGAGGAGDQDEPGDIIFIFAGAGPYAVTLELEAGQQLIGEGEGLVLGGQSIVPAGTAPTLTSAAGNGIILASDNTIRGLEVGNTLGVDIVGSNFGTLRLSNVTLGGTGGALNLSNGALDAAFNSISSTNSTGRGINLDTVTGTFSSGSTSVTDSAQAGIRVVNGGSTYSFGPTTLSSTGSGLELTSNATSSFNFTSLSVTTDAGPGLLASSSGTLNIGGAGNSIVAVGGAAVDITSTSFGSGATFTTLSSSSSPGKGANLDNVSGSFTASGGSITSAAGIAFDLNAGTGSISYGGSITNAAARAVEVTGRSTSTVTLSGNVSDSGTGVNISGNSGGTVTLSGTYSGTAASSQLDVTGNSGTAVVNFSGSSKTLSTGASNAVDVTSNGTAQVNFTGGGLGITTTSGVGFNATGGAGAVTVQGSGNTISSTTGTALNVASTPIGASGLTFQSISAGTGSGSSGVGISLDNTGIGASDGGLTVTGNSAAGSGGTIQHKTGADASLTSGIGIFLRSTKNPSFNWMQLNDFDNAAVLGRNVHGFTLQNSVINGVNGTSSAAAGDGAIYFGLSNPGGTNGLQGTGLIRNTKISGAVEHNVEFYNQSGSMNLTIDGTSPVNAGAPADPSDDTADCVIEENSTAFGSDGILIELQTDGVGGAPQGTVLVSRCLFRDNKSQAMQVNALGGSNMNVTFQESRVTKNVGAAGQGNEGIVYSNGNTGVLDTTIQNNSFFGIGGANIFVVQVAGNALATSNLTARILNNTITAGSATVFPTNRSLLVFLTSTPGAHAPANIRVHGNSITTFSDPVNGIAEPIFVSTPDAGTDPYFTARVTDNSVTINDSAGTSLRGIGIQATQGNTPPNNSQGCFIVSGNNVTYVPGPPAGVNGLRVRQNANGSVRLERGAALLTDPAATVLDVNNPATVEALGTVTVVENGTCLPQP
jgi:uncharacterized repeat protein (TIGR01451 family)